ncbi:MAG: 3-keto-5-aminohexanoate cleavage protein, partial [Pseudomonadota bacterium]|nr:3-keto-5-aminohexanoate cleavage protein [Pseudomonadota bacterium]
MIAVAPNGARLNRSQHSGVPIWPRELANTARQCLDAGASMIHVHV